MDDADVARRLRTLAELNRSGVLSDAEYEAATAEVVRTAKAPAREAPQPTGAGSPTARALGEPARSRSRLRRGLLVAGLILALAGFGGGVWAFLAFRGTGDALARMVPDDATVYVTAYLDPAAGQKAALLSLARKFPESGNLDQLSQRLDGLLDARLSDLGLSSSDVRPWVGAQVAFVLKDPEAANPSMALLITSKNDADAKGTLGKLRSAAAAQGLHWSDGQHNGVAVSVGVDDSTGSSEAAYAVLDHTVILASHAGVVHDIIDTAQGKHRALPAAEGFSRTVARLPRRALGLAYVDLAPLTRLLQGPEAQLYGTALAGPLDAFVGAGLALSAEPTGVAADLAVAFDPSKLSAEQGRALTEQAPPGPILSFAPEDAYGVVVTPARAELDALIEQLRELPGSDFATLDAQLGLSEAIEHVGSVSVAVGPGNGEAVLDGAVVVSTDDEAAMRRFLARAAAMLVPELDGDPSLAEFAPRLQTEAYQGATITSLPVPGLSGFAPAFAVTDGVAIVASSPAHVKKVVDARAQKQSITTTERFRETIRHVDAQNSTLLYVDLEAALDAAQNAEGPLFPQEAAPYLKPLRAVVLTSKASEQERSIRLFVLIE